MWELDHNEGWVPKNWCFWTVVLEKMLESPLDSKEIKPVIPKEINPEYSLEGLILKWKLLHFGHLMGRAKSLEKILILGKIEGRGEGVNREWDSWMASLTQWTWSLIKLRELGKDRETWCSAVHEVQGVRYNLATEQQKQQQHELKVCWGNNEHRMNWHVKFLPHNLNRCLEVQLQHSLEPDYFLIMYHVWSQINKWIRVKAQDLENRWTR